MPLTSTKYFGTVSCEDGDRYHFPLGLPGFENEKSFVLMNVPGRQPLVFLQSTSTPQLCFLTLPILVVDPEYRLSVSFEDLEILELETTRQPQLGDEVLVLALLSIQDVPAPTANLLAPLVINLGNHCAIQAIRCDTVYSHQHPLPALIRSEAC
jgi:flagellar assembly factor FliW